MRKGRHKNWARDERGKEKAAGWHLASNSEDRQGNHRHQIRRKWGAPVLIDLDRNRGAYLRSELYAMQKIMGASD